jgi:polyhydroxyalkanoate synthesis regulator phasin
MTNFQEMMNPTELTKNNAKMMTGLMDKVWENYDAQCEGVNQFNQKMSDMMDQTITAAKTQSEPITSKIGLKNEQSFKLIDQMVDQSRSTQKTMMNIGVPYMKQVKNSMYNAIDTPNGFFDSMSNNLSSNPAFKSYMDLSKQVAGFYKMPWMNLDAGFSSATADSAAKTTAKDAPMVKKKDN